MPERVSSAGTVAVPRDADRRLRWSGVSFRYPTDERWTLQEIELSLEAGQPLLVVGAEGSGRSTLLAVAAGLASAYGGQLRGDVILEDGPPLPTDDSRPARDRDVQDTVGPGHLRTPRRVQGNAMGVAARTLAMRSAALGRWSEQVALVPSQPRALLSATRSTVMEEVAAGLEWRAIARDEMLERVVAVLSSVGALHLAARVPLSLSAGETVRVGLACMLVTRPAALLLDEVDASLDAVGLAALRAICAVFVADGGLLACAPARLDDWLRPEEDPPGLELRRAVVLADGMVHAAGAPLSVLGWDVLGDEVVGPEIRGGSVSGNVVPDSNVPADDALGSDSIGDEVVGGDLLGDSALGRHVLGSDALDADVPGSDVLGRDALDEDALAGSARIRSGLGDGAPAAVGVAPALAALLAGVHARSGRGAPISSASRLARPSLSAASLPGEPAPARLELRGLRVVYPGDLVAIDDFSLDIEPGSVLALVGANGSGKTTVLRAILGLATLDQGIVRLGGRDVSDLDVASRAALVAMVGARAEDHLFARTVREEVAFGPRNLRFHKAKVEQLVGRALVVCGLEGVTESHPLDLATGMRRWVSIAAALAMATPVIALDEPTIGLDHSGRERLHALLRALSSSGRTIALVSHDLDFVADVADRAAVLSAGRLLGIAPTQQIITDDALLAAAALEPPAAQRLARHYGLNPALTSARRLRAFLATRDGP